MEQRTNRPDAVDAPTPKKRDPWFDNAKMTLVTLVVIGHSWTLLPTDDSNQQWFYDFLYSWHVPAFVMVTGYLSKSFEWTPKRMWGLFTGVLVPYVVFEAALASFRLIFGGEKLDQLWADPHWPMWYLAALFFWRLLTPIFKRLPAPVVLAVLLSLAAGLWAGNILDMSRVFGLLPFFVLGLKMHEGHWNLLRSRRARYFGIAAMLVIFVLARYYDNWAETEWLYYRSRYDQLDPNDARAAVIRMCLLLVGTVGALAFFAIVTRTKSIWTTWGANSLVVYLFHGFFILGIGFMGFPQWSKDHFWLAFVLVTAFSILLSILLSLTPIARVLSYFIDPIGTFQHSPRRVARKRARAASRSGQD